MTDRSEPVARTVVVVEDEPFVRDLAVSELEDSGYPVVDFSTADEALRYLAGHASAIAAVFTDIQMPGRLSGLDLAEIIDRTWPAIGLLVTSGGLRIDAARLPHRARFVQKPWRAAEVLACLGDLGQEQRQATPIRA